MGWLLAALSMDPECRATPGNTADSCSGKNQRRSCLRDRLFAVEFETSAAGDSCAASKQEHRLPPRDPSPAEVLRRNGWLSAIRSRVGYVAGQTVDAYCTAGLTGVADPYV